MATCQDESDISSEEYTSDEEFVLPEIKALKQANEKGDLHTQRERIIKTRKESGSPTLCNSWGFFKTPGRFVDTLVILNTFCNISGILPKNNEKHVC